MWSPSLVGLLFFVAVVSAGIGVMTTPPRTAATILADAMSVPVGVLLGDATVLFVVGPVPASTLEFVLPSEFTVPRPVRIIILSVRPPRIFLAAFVGFVLAAAGVVM